MDEQQETTETYNRYAARYAERYQAIELTEQLETFANQLFSGACVLDLGCGPGRDIGFLRARGLNVVGADLSLGMLQEARSRGSSDLVLGDMTILPFAAEAFDGAWLAASFHHLPRELALPTLHGIRRSLKQPGTLYVSVKVGEGLGWQNVEEGKRFYTFYQPDILVALLEQARFDVVKQWQETDGQGRQWVDIIARTF